MLKFLIILIMLAVGAYFVVNQIPSLKERVIEAINPAAKEERLLGELKANLDEVEKSLEETAQQKGSDKIREKISNSKNLLEKSKNLLGEISKINQDTGIIGSQIGKIIDAFSDQTPYPADHLGSNTPPPAPACSCPPR
jgi:DNA repair exonuclease SbcCD ATPase subunit